MSKKKTNAKQITSTEPLDTTQIRDLWIKKTQEFLMSDELFKTKRELFNKVKKLIPKKDSHIAESTFYKYLKLMKFRMLPNGIFGFEDDNSIYLDTLIDEQDFTDQVYFRLRDAIYGPIIAKLVNKNQNFEGFLHCVAIQDLLICFFNIPNTEKKEISNYIRTTAEHYMFYNHSTDM